jgi:drug/metabolite transporter (DMT)-like permease
VIRTRPRPALGIGLMLLAVTCFAALDTTVRWLGTVVPVIVMLTARYCFQALAMAAWLARSRRLRFAAAHPRFQVLRGLLLLVTSAFSFFGLQRMPVPEFTAIIMLTPVLVTLFAALLLKEHVSTLRWALVAVAFAGALVVIRPGAGVFGWPVFFPLAGATTYAAFQVLTSRLAGLDNPYTTHFWTGFVGSALLVPLLLAGPFDAAAALAALTPAHLGWLLVVGACGTVGHLFLIVALGVAPTAALMPLNYMQIAIAAALGWLVFGHVPDGWAAVGMAIIAAAGAASAWLNVVRRAPSRVITTTFAD